MRVSEQASGTDLHGENAVGAGASSVLAECESACSKNTSGESEGWLGAGFLLGGRSFPVCSQLVWSLSVLPETLLCIKFLKICSHDGSFPPLNINTINLPCCLKTE